MDAHCTGWRVPIAMDGTGGGSLWSWMAQVEGPYSHGCTLPQVEGPYSHGCTLPQVEGPYSHGCTLPQVEGWVIPYPMRLKLDAML